MSVLFLHNLNLVDFEKKSIKKCSILINHGKIEEILRDDVVAPFRAYPERIEGMRKTFARQANYINIKKNDLHGAYVIPGFIDSHTHLLAHGIEKQRIDLSDCHSLNDCLEKMRANLSKEDKILFGVHWDESNWRINEKGQLNKSLLDKISDKKPVIMRRVCGHFAVCNAKALEFIPQGWHIVDRKRGYLYEDAALYLNQIFKPSEEMLVKGLELAINEAHSLGITSIHEITDIPGLKVYQKLKGRLKLRVALYLPLSIMETIISCGFGTDFGDDFLKFTGIKIFLDGSIGAKTAAMCKPYAGSKNLGKLLISEKNLIKIVKRAQENSLQLMIHSIGDRATDVVLKAFKQTAVKENKLRHRLEHLELVADKQIKEISKLGFIASIQPNFVRWQKPGGMYEQYLGERYKTMNCYKKFADAGVKVIFGSDCMPIGPLYGIRGAINHPFVCGRLEPADAFNFYTTQGAYGTFDEEKKGKIEPGKFADFVVLDKNPLIKENLDKLKILMVFIRGKIVYKNC